MVNATRSSSTGWMSTGSRLVRVAKRVMLIVTLLCLTVGAYSVSRAWAQVRRLDVQVMSPNVRPGLPVVVQVVTSGRTPVDVRLELVQGTHAEMLATLRVAASRDGFLDPRDRLGTMTPTFTPEFLAHFQGGPAIVRATAVGRPQWLHTPAPVVREVPVALVP